MQQINFLIQLPLASIALLVLFSCTPKTTPTSIITSTINIIQNTPLATNTITPSQTASPFPQKTISIPDGKIAYADTEGIHIIDTSGKLISDTKITGFIGYGMLYHSPAWSPDGHKIAFVGEEIRTVGNGIYSYPEIYIVNVDGSNLKKITSYPQYHKSYLSWSPDGNYILTRMQRFIPKGESPNGVYLIQSQNGEIKQQLLQDVGRYITWTQDGMRILFSNPESNKLYSMDSFGNNIELIGDIDIPNSMWASMSPDGNEFVVVNDFQCGDLFIASRDGNKKTQITKTNYSESYPSWSPDEQLLLYERESTLCGDNPPDRWWNIYIADKAGNEVKLLPKVIFPSDSAILSPVPAFKLGSNYQINRVGENLNLRTEPGLHGKIIKKLPAGEIIIVLEGPIDVDNYYWWKIRTSDGTEGWIVEMAYWYKPVEQ
jgi:dipeptidyl aminopeptidase/acylaminoacyl peptidase